MGEIKDLMDDEKRPTICKNDFGAFFFWYFQKYLTHTTPEFHYKMYKDLEFLGVEYRFLVWIMFRESAKTALARAHAVWCIVYRKKMNIYWIGHDLKKAEKNARAIANELQSNKWILLDFGQLYYEDIDEKRRINKKSKPKKITEFKAENGCLFSACSTNISMRGALEDEFRPDQFYFDDIETDKTKKSVVVTQGIKDFIDETISGASIDCGFLFLGNYISKYGVVQDLMNRCKKNDEWKLRFQPIAEDGKLVWPEKYTFTKKEAFEANKGLDRPKERLESLESKKENVGTLRYDQEFMCIPMTEGDRIIKESWFENGRNRYKMSQLVEDERGLFWFIQDGHRYKLIIMAAIDPAISTKETSDDRAIITGAYFWEKVAGMRTKKYLILESRAGKWGLLDFSKQVSNASAKFDPLKIGCEDNGVQQVFRQYFSIYGISTVSLNPKGDKMHRMMKNVADFEFGRVLFPENGSCDDVLAELFNFTGEDGIPDNLVDAINYVLQMLKGGDLSQQDIPSHTGQTIAGNIGSKRF